MVIQYRCEAGRINSVLWSLSLVSIVLMLVYTPLVQASKDDDIELQFYWTPATGNVSYYNVYLFVYDSPDAPGPSGEDDYKWVDDTSRTHGSDAPTQDKPYTLDGAMVEDGKGYQIKVAAVDTNGTVGLRSEPSEIVWCALNDPPVAHDQSVVTAEDTTVSITLTGNDPDGDPLTYTVVSNPSNGSLSGTAPNLTYTPNADYNDSFTFKVNDGILDSNTATVTISVNSPENITAMILLDKFDYSYNKSTNETSLMVTWTNTGTSRLFRPLLMVIENTLPSSIYATNADGTTPDGKLYYDHSDRVSGGKLGPGKTSGAKELIFSGPKNILRRIRFRFDVSCWAVIESSTAVESVASLSITVDPILDSDSSSFIPPTDVPLGWHLISIPVQPIDTHPSAVLSPIEGKYSSAWAYDPDTGWSVYAPGLPGGLQSMEPGRGYWIKMEEEGTLDVEGSDPGQTAITLIGGKWNLVGYSSQDPRYAEDCMEHVADAINSVWGYDPNTGWSVYEPGSPGDLTVMKPWYGYWIKADRTCTWDVNKASASAAPSAAVK